MYLDDRRRAHTIHALLTPFAQLNAVAAGEICLGSVARYVGRLATVLDLREEAETQFDTALEMNSRMGARPWLAATQTDYAELLLRRAAPGDRERAQMFLDEAGRTFEELGMPRGVARAHGLAAGQVNGAATPR